MFFSTSKKQNVAANTKEQINCICETERGLDHVVSLTCSCSSLQKHPSDDFCRPSTPHQSCPQKPLFGILWFSINCFSLKLDYNCLYLPRMHWRVSHVVWHHIVFLDSLRCSINLFVLSCTMEHRVAVCTNFTVVKYSTAVALSQFISPFFCQCMLGWFLVLLPRTRFTCPLGYVWGLIQ